MAECDAQGASVARVALAHGINANVVHSWRKRARGGVGVPVQLVGEFVPVAALAPTAPPEAIQIQLRRGASTLTISWPASAAAQLAQWTREVLQ